MFEPKRRRPLYLVILARSAGTHAAQLETIEPVPKRSQFQTLQWPTRRGMDSRAARENDEEGDCASALT